MKVVWKYNVEISSSDQLLSLPRGAQFLSCQIQGKTPQVWMLVDPDATEEVRSFRTFATGEEIPEGFSHLATFQIGMFVFHLFERNAP